MTDDGGGFRPRVGVLGYGSILAPQELEDVLADHRSEVVPVRVDGFKRLFNQEATWRPVDGPERAVLNVVQAEDYWFNAVLLADLTRAEFRRYRKRERGYRLVEVDRDDVTPYDVDDGSRLEPLDLVLVATGEKTREDIDPIQKYLDLCLRGADHWDGEFAREFVDTTHTATGEPLRTILEER